PLLRATLHPFLRLLAVQLRRRLHQISQAGSIQVRQRPNLHVTHALARPLEQALGIRERRGGIRT
ncbi:MAG: hypothetical protein ACRDG5_02085, partial [Anaerolineales bacterium]